MFGIAEIDSENLTQAAGSMVAVYFLFPGASMSDYLVVGASVLGSAVLYNMFLA